jgi:Mor family transcriptional regulator
MPEDKAAKHAFQETIHERRKKMLKFHFRGIPATEWVSQLAQKYDVSERAIWEDWRRRKDWLGKVFELADMAYEINMNMAELSNVKEEAWRTYYGTENAQGKAAALKIILRAIRDKIEILQSLGEVRREPLKSEVGLKIKKDGEDIVELLKKYAPVIERVANRDFPPDVPEQPAST